MYVSIIIVLLLYGFLVLRQVALHPNAELKNTTAEVLFTKQFKIIDRIRSA